LRLRGRGGQRVEIGVVVFIVDGVWHALEEEAFPGLIDECEVALEEVLAAEERNALALAEHDEWQEQWLADDVDHKALGVAVVIDGLVARGADFHELAVVGKVYTELGCPVGVQRRDVSASVERRQGAYGWLSVGAAEADRQ
jgi:hypothetical protein